MSIEAKRRPQERGVDQKEGEKQYDILSNPEVRERLLRRTRELVNQIREMRIDNLVFLDKSARPLSWLMRAYWEEHIDEPMPAVSFLNIGTSNPLIEDSGNVLHSKRDIHSDEERAAYNQSKGHVEEVDILSEWITEEDVPAYWRKKVHAELGMVQKMRESFGDTFDGKDVLVVGDFTFSGRAQMAAISLLIEAFPTANVWGTAYHKSVIESGGSDRALMPWLHIPGMAGVIEYDAESPFSSGITDARVTALRERIVQVKQQLLDQVNTFRIESLIKDRWLSESVKECATQEFFSHKLEAFTMLATEIENAVRLFLENGTFDSKQFSTYMQEAQQLLTGVKEDAAQSFGEQSDEVTQIESLEKRLMTLDVRNEWYFHRIEEYTEFLEKDYISAKHLIERGKKLRKELTFLGREG